MDIYEVEKKNNTPKVYLDANKHQIEFEGDSRPEDVRKFYQPINDWIDTYEAYITQLAEGGETIDLICHFNFEYFNSSSAKHIMDIINKIGAIDDNNPAMQTIFNWYYDEMDEDMLDAGKEFEEMVNAKFNYVIVE
jgi:hypothetical protein